MALSAVCFSESRFDARDRPVATADCHARRLHGCPIIQSLTYLRP